MIYTFEDLTTTGAPFYEIFVLFYVVCDLYRMIQGLEDRLRDVLLRGRGESYETSRTFGSPNSCCRSDVWTVPRLVAKAWLCAEARTVKISVARRYWDRWRCLKDTGTSVMYGAIVSVVSFSDYSSLSIRWECKALWTFIRHSTCSLPALCAQMRKKRNYYPDSLIKLHYLRLPGSNNGLLYLRTFS